MKVSVITPSFNSRKYIRGNIESLLSQTTGDIEHIVVDGGSRDGTVDVLKMYPHLKWVSEPDGGMYDAINRGIRMSAGDVVAYLNVDDRYFPDTINKVAIAFEDNPDVDFIYGDCEYIDEKGAALFTMRPLSYLWARHSLGLLWCQPSWFWRRRVQEKAGFFDPRLRYVGDVEFMRRCVVQGLKGLYVPQTLSQFMLRRDCLSIQGKENCERERLAVRRQYQVEQWSLPRIAAEMIFAVKNLGSYRGRMEFRRLRQLAMEDCGSVQGKCGD
jgi:glycosyltransferase involved in cell wall biosynthesis